MSKVPHGSRCVKTDRILSTLPPLEVLEGAEIAIASGLPELAAVILDGDGISPTVAFCGAPMQCDYWAEGWEQSTQEGDYPRAVVVPVEYLIAGRVFAAGKAGAA